jgi:hypothetical protein
MKHWYHPTPAVKGSACSFYLNDSENAFFASIIKQKTWDAKTRRASFHRDEPNQRVIIKFSCKEICQFINAIENNGKFEGYHGTQNSAQIVKFRFGPYHKKTKGSDGDWSEGPQVGFSLTVNKEMREDSTNKQSFAMGFDFAESTELKLLLEYLVQKSFDNERKLRAKKKKEYERSSGGNSKTTSTTKQPVAAAEKDNESEIW